MLMLLAHTSKELGLVKDVVKEDCSRKEESLHFRVTILWENDLEFVTVCEGLKCHVAKHLRDDTNLVALRVLNHELGLREDAQGGHQTGCLDNVVYFPLHV